MREIKEGTSHLFFRYMNIRNMDFIQEHKNIISKNRYTWIGKYGKKINRLKVAEIFQENNEGVLLIKSPRSEGSRYYICQILAFCFDEPTDGVFPAYYNTDIEKSDIDVWFKVSSIIEVSDDVVDSFICSSNNESIRKTSDKTMTSYMFIKTIKSIKIQEGVQ